MANFRTPKIVGLLVPENFGADAAVPPELGLCDLLELRFDLFRGAKPGELVSRARAAFPGKPLLFTVRLERDGGAWPDGDAGARFPLFAEALEAGADWADAELDEPGLVRRLRPVLARTGSKLLVSNHLWSAPESAEACEALWRSALRLEGDGVKLVWKMDDRKAEGILTEFLLRHGNDPRLVACFAMGEGGRLSRLYGPLMGAPWTYGFCGSGAPAPGQWKIAEMRDCFAKIAPLDAENGLNRLKSALEEWEKARFSTFGHATWEDA